MIYLPIIFRVHLLDMDEIDQQQATTKQSKTEQILTN